jgi:arabinofuranan 3-O-arabinosyltransferase
VRLVGAVDAAEARQPLVLEACDGALDLSGEVALRAASGRDTGIDLDALDLSSDPEGHAVEPGVTGTVSTPPDLEVDTPHLLEYSVTADTDDPFWLVVGQSYGPEWEAEVDNGSLGGHQVISGYANGWYVEPSGDGPVTIGVTWPPQRQVWVAVALSIVALVACLVVLILDPRRRPGRLHDPPPAVTLMVPFAPERRLVSGRPAALAIAGTAVVSWMFATPAVALAVTAAMVLTLGWRWGALVTRLAAVGIVAFAAVFIFAKQIRNDPPADFGWPQNFESVHWLTMTAVLLLAVDVVAALVRRREPKAAP